MRRFAATCVRLPAPHSSVRVAVEPHDYDLERDTDCRYEITYDGTAADLIAAGAATAALLRRHYPGKTRRTPAGDRCFLVRRNGRIRLWYWVSPETADAMPGVRQWAADWIGLIRNAPDRARAWM